MMNSSSVEDMGYLIMNSIKDHGRMKLYSDKGAFIFENGEEKQITVLKEDFGLLHNCLIKRGLKYDSDTKEYYLNKRPLRSSFKRERPSPDNHMASSSKRSKSAPNKEDEEDDKENSKPRGRQMSRANAASHKKITSTPLSSRSKSENRPQKVHYIDFHGCTLIGDDFLLGIAMFNLKGEMERTRNRLHCGLCISGLTISEATRKLKTIKNQEMKRALIYLGSFDIIERKELIEMINDFDALVKVCEEKDIKVVACTLAPIALYHDQKREETLEGFNKYLKTSSTVSVIDVNKIFSYDDPKILKYCYEGYMKAVSGSTMKAKLWDKMGRDLFTKFVKVNLGFAMIDETPAVHDRDYMKILREILI